MADPIPAHPDPSWKWLVCGMLMLAGMLNYMDRLTLNSLVKSIETDLDFEHDRYGRVEAAFGVAFAFGALGMGWLVDRFGVRWMFPLCVLGWSLAGFLTGFAPDYDTLLACRFLLGAFEAGLMPCALRTTQQILTPQERGMGNALLQSGPAIGAVLTPFLCVRLSRHTGTWRTAFWVIGIIGVGWTLLWSVVVRRGNLPAPTRVPATPAASSPVHATPRTTGLLRRFIVLIVVVISINLTWHFYRSWLSLYLQEGHDYTEEDAADVMSGYYIAADIGTLLAGYATLTLARRGLSVHASRMLVYAACAGLVTLSIVGTMLSPGVLLILMLFVVGFGALGVFPCYYSFSQELTSRHQGKVTGALSFCCWMSVSAMQLLVGEHIKATKSYTLAINLFAFLPLLGLLALLLFWGRDHQAQADAAVATTADESYKSEGTHPAPPGPPANTTHPRGEP